MTYEQIDQLILAKDLFNDSAFEDLIIAIEPISCTDGCPLGLYFPVDEWSPHVERMVSEGTIILPPDATQGALLHELGHRHAHYHYDDLSERAAENFRKRYQKGRALLYLGNDFARLPKFGPLFEEGERGAVEIGLMHPLTRDELYQIKSALYVDGERAKIYHGNSEVAWLRVEFTKGADWLVIIGASLAGIVAATAGVIGYAVYKTAKDLPWIVPLVLFGPGAALILRAAIKQEKIKARLPI